MTLCPLAANAGGREPHTSPRPPVFDQGATCSQPEQSASRCFTQQSSQIRVLSGQALLCTMKNST